VYIVTVPFPPFAILYDLHLLQTFPWNTVLMVIVCRSMVFGFKLIGRTNTVLSSIASTIWEPNVCFYLFGLHFKELLPVFNFFICNSYYILNGNSSRLCMLANYPMKNCISQEQFHPTFHMVIIKHEKFIEAYQSKM
jgi:hypothetical protein